MALYLFKKTVSLAYMSRPYLGALTMRPAVSYRMYATLYHEKTGKIISLANFEEVNLVENESNAEEYESITASIDESSTEYDSDDGSISTIDLKDIRDRSQVHPELNARDARLRMIDRI